MPPDSAPSDAAAKPAEPGISGAEYLRLVLVGAAIGIPAGLVSIGFLALVHQLEDLLWHDLPDALGQDSPPFYLILLLPVTGACFVVAARRVLPGDGGHKPVDGISATPTPAAYAPSVALAALGSLPFGAVLGPEAPLIALGSALGMLVASRVDLDPRQSAVLGTAGSFAAIAALFGGPLPAGVLLVEASVGAGLGAATIPLLLPGLVASAIGYLLFTGVGDWGGLDQEVLAVPGLEPYDGVRVVDLVVAVGVGVAAAILVAGIHGLAQKLASAEGARVTMPTLLVGGAAAVGALALAADALGANPEDVLFSGQSSIPDLLTEGSAAIILVLVAAKGLAYGISLGCGFRGGPVFPAIFVGVALAMFCVDVFDVSPTLAVAVGTAAGVAAATRLVFSALVIAALLVGTGSTDALPAAILAAVAAYLGVAALERRAAGAPATPVRGSGDTDGAPLDARS
jgi:H+/Cl- antiporter ClcA